MVHHQNMIFSTQIIEDCLKNKEVVCTFVTCMMMTTIFFCISPKKTERGDLTICYIVMAIIAIETAESDF